MIAECGVTLRPPTITETEFAVAVFVNHRRIAALRVYQTARASMLSDGRMGVADQVDLAADAGMDRAEAEWQLTAAAVAGKLDSIRGGV